MIALIVGAGATIEEANRSGVSSELQFPVISNFAKVMWKDYLPHPFLIPFLNSQGVITDPQGRTAFEVFLRLEADKKTNVEVFFEYCWKNRNKFPEHPTAWEDMLYHGFANPIVAAMATSLFENGKGWRELKASNLLSSYLRPGDVVVNLNYDTVFELSMEMSKKPFHYLPNISKDSIAVAKPHGSINLLVNQKEGTFFFGQPDIPGTVVPSKDLSMSASLLPPRLSKDYASHPIADAIIKPLVAFAPSDLLFWGVGFTESDTNVNEIYKHFARTAGKIEVINPDMSTWSTVAKILEKDVKGYRTLDDWLTSREG
ncbi:MAG: hypothetical protein KF854_00795 [Nitrospira sp.]|nr:hypothetical protein [Nitrospira sp.]MBX3513128.1 hypothetical protein [Xanthobacteraceae bacterium]